MARHVYALRPRWSDLDAFGHVNNVAWLEYLQEARADMLFVHASGQGAERLAEGVLVVRAELVYKRPMVFRQDPYLIEMTVPVLGAASFTIDYDIVDPASLGGTRYGTASTTLAPVDLASGRPRRLTERERAALTAFTG